MTTVPFPGVPLCLDCRHPEGSHVMENKACAVGGCKCQQYLPGGEAAAVAGQPTTESTTPAPAPVDSLAPVQAEKPSKSDDFARRHLGAARLGLSAQFQQMAFALVQQVVANDLIKFLRGEPGRRVVLTSSNGNGIDIHVEAYNPDGTPFDETGASNGD